MTTAAVYIFDKFNKPFKCRALLDTCASANFMSMDLFSKLNLKKENFELSIEGLNGTGISTKYYVNTTIKSINSNFQKQLDFFVIPSIAAYIPAQNIPRHNLMIPRNIKLADPNFERPAPIDLLIGSGPTLSLFCLGQISVMQNSNKDLILQKTKLGWIIGGDISQDVKKNHCFFSTLEFDLQRFWQLEEVSELNKLTEQELECEDHFNNHFTRDSDGRYVVALPFRKNSKPLGDSREKALKLFHSLINRLNKNPCLKQQYAKVLEEYIHLGHMSPVPNRTNAYENVEYFLPHHAVIKNDSSTTKVRVVFNASSKTTNGVSLNDNLLTGPTLQSDLFAHLIRFRFFLFAIIADIEKMYRQFLVRENDRKYQKIFWYEKEELKEYELNTVTFGMASSTYLAVKCLLQLVKDEGNKFPLASKAIKNNMYVDNLLSGADNLKDAQTLCNEINLLLKKGQLNMRQWASNDQRALSYVDKNKIDENYYFDDDCTLKTLGLFWKTKNDTFVFTIKSISCGNKLTKRIILSEIAKIFDPLGLLGPVILYAKLIIQDLWREKIEWDESVSIKIYTKWSSFCKELQAINNITFPRLITLNNYKEIELHGFSDASKHGYGACIYIRTKDSHDKYSSHILCSKSRVAPLKTRTTPQLELCGAVLLVNLYEQVVRNLKIKFTNAIFWCDSQIVLHWIHTDPGLFKTFVSNRLKEIHKKSNNITWQYIKSEENPADSLSRGQLPNKFKLNKIWKYGPDWLNKNKTYWPEPTILKIKDVPELKKLQCFTSHIIKPNVFPIFKKFNCFTKLRRSVAWWIRFLHKKHHCKPLDVNELKHAEKIILKKIQLDAFSIEIKYLKDKKHIPKKSTLFLLNPFVDEDGLLRVGGRINKSALSFTKRHPIILPRRHYVSDLIINYYHLKNYHSGAQTTLYDLRQKFWVINGRQETRQVLRKCIICARAKPTMIQYEVGSLPSVRVKKARPFYNSGVDYCGPFYIKEKSFRNQKFIKCYAAIFVCMVTKAVHIEIVSDLTTENFLNALKRFINRRGFPANIYSDNASNFKGASNELLELFKLLQSKGFNETVNKFCTENASQWHFIPPYSPNFGGLWEANVKLFKYHFKRVAYNRRFTFEQFQTFATEIEAIINSRPLTPMSVDPNDLTALTPGHFLIGDSMKCLPSVDYESLPDNRLTAYEIITKIKNDFWKQWYKQYINELIVHYQKQTSNIKLKKGMMVILKDKDLPSMQWHLGRVEELHPGEDNVIRAATIRTSSGLHKRATTNFAILPLDD